MSDPGWPLQKPCDIFVISLHYRYGEIVCLLIGNKTRRPGDKQEVSRRITNPIADSLCPRKCNESFTEIQMRLPRVRMCGGGKRENEIVFFWLCFVSPCRVSIEPGPIALIRMVCHQHLGRAPQLKANTARLTGLIFNSFFPLCGIMKCVEPGVCFLSLFFFFLYHTELTQTIRTSHFKINQRGFPYEISFCGRVGDGYHYMCDANPFSVSFCS